MRNKKTYGEAVYEVLLKTYGTADDLGDFIPGYSGGGAEQSKKEVCCQ